MWSGFFYLSVINNKAFLVAFAIKEGLRYITSYPQNN